MTPAPDALDLALSLARELEARAVPYAIGGALALGAWSDPRGTKDVDVNVFVDLARLDDILDAVEAAGATLDRARARREANDRGMFVSAFPNGMRLDVFTPSIDFSWEAARTRVRLVSRGQEADFLVAMFGEDDERVRFWDETVASQRLPDEG